jgi:hypothetical protein
MSNPIEPTPIELLGSALGAATAAFIIELAKTQEAEAA